MIAEMWPSLTVSLELKTKLLSQKTKGKQNTGRNYTEKITVNTSVSTKCLEN